MLLTIQQTAEYLGVPYYIVVNMIHKGHIPCVREDLRKVRLREEDVRAYKEAHAILARLKQAA